jgi:Reverse transcriptase (RNA-dependent DNA polymerase)/RNase H-like domain found in reverse transcriptase
MQEILSPYLWVFMLVYIDDIMVYSHTFDKHLDHVSKVLGAFRESGITLAPHKCHIGYHSIQLLGQKVSHLGLSTNTKKVKAVTALATPHHHKDLETFLGMAVYFAAYIPCFSGIAAPLFTLLKKGTPWIWKAEHEEAYNMMKRVLMSAPVCGHPLRGQGYRLYTDTSDMALAGALQQIQPILVKDLLDTKVYKHLHKAYDEGSPIPELTIKLLETHDDQLTQGVWANSFNKTTVHIERVIVYWSCT